MASKDELKKQRTTQKGALTRTESKLKRLVAEEEMETTTALLAEYKKDYVILRLVAEEEMETTTALLAEYKKDQG